jgi:hypothetical protein
MSLTGRKEYWSALLMAASSKRTVTGSDQDTDLAVLKIEADGLSRLLF